MSEVVLNSSEPAPPDGHEWVSKQDAAHRLKVSEKTIEQMRNDGELIGFRREKAKRGEPLVLIAMPIVVSKEQELTEQILQLSEQIGQLSEEDSEKAQLLRIAEDEVRKLSERIEQLSEQDAEMAEKLRLAEEQLLEAAAEKEELLRIAQEEARKLSEELSEAKALIPKIENQLRITKDELSESQTKWQILNREKETVNTLVVRQKKELITLETLRSERDEARMKFEELMSQYRKDALDLRREVHELRKPWFRKSIDKLRSLIASATRDSEE